MNLRENARRLLLTLLLAAPALAQDSGRFDPSRDLEGFDACYSSDFREFYGVEEFSALLGRELDAGELEKVRERWKAARAGGDAKVRALRTEPAEESAWLLRHRLGKSSYFSKITLVEDRSVPGFLFLVQRPPKDVPDHAAKVAGAYGPWLAKIAALFDEGYAKPLGLVRPPKHALWAIGLLASQGDYHNYWRFHPNPCANAWWACYDTTLGLVVGYEDLFQPGGAPADRRYPILHAAVREMIFAHTTSKDGRPWAMWVEEGLASFLAYHDGLAPACLDQRRIRPETLKTIVGFAEDAAKRNLVLHSIEVLASVREPEELDRIVTLRCGEAGVARPTENDVVAAFYGQSTLWMHFLHTARDGALREGFLRYFQWALSGNGGPDALREALDGENLGALDREFFRWVFAEHQRAFPEAKTVPAVVDLLFPVAKSPALPAPAGADPAEPPFSPSVLAIGPAEAVERHGLALLSARAGDIEGAIEALKAVAQAKPAPPEDGRVAREIDRLSELVELRDGFVESLRRSGTKWTIDHDGKKLVATVVAVEGGSVRIAENRLGVSAIPLTALDPLEIARQAAKREQQGDSKPWARFYAYVLAGDARWEKLLKPDSDEASALREDARTWYPATIRTGQAAAAVEKLARSSLPASGAEGKAACDAIRALIAEHGELPLVQRRIGDLRKLAAAGLDASLSEANPASFLHCKWTDLGERKVSVVYEFDEAAEAADLVKQIGYLSDWRKGIKIEAGKEEESSWSVRGGRFEGTGAACYVLPLSFVAPMTVRYELEVQGTEDDENKRTTFWLGLCDDGKRSNIQIMDFGHLYVRNAAKEVRNRRAGADDFAFFLSTPYSFEVHHDGEKVTVSIDGEKVNEAPCADRRDGRVFLWFHTALPVSIDRLEIEGTIEPSSAASLRAARVAEELAGMGFPR